MRCLQQVRWDRMVIQGWIVSCVVHVLFTLTAARTLTPAAGRAVGEQTLEVTFADEPDAQAEMELVVPVELALSDDVYEAAFVDPMVELVNEQREADQARLVVPPSLSGAAERDRSADGAGERQGVEIAPPGTTAEFFGTLARGDRFVYILDKSGSMDHGDGTSPLNRYQRALQELLASIDRLTEEQSFCVILFSDASRHMHERGRRRPRMLPATIENKVLFRDWLATVRPGGGTDPRGALRAGLALNPSGLFLLSDGEFACKARTKWLGFAMPSNLTVSDVVSRYNFTQAPVHTIAFIDVASRPRMQRLAEQTGGQHRFIATLDPNGVPLPPPPPPPPRRKSTVPRQITLLALGRALESAGKHEAAVKRYREIVENHARTTEATEAEQRIERLVDR